MDKETLEILPPTPPICVPCEDLDRKILSQFSIEGLLKVKKQIEEEIERRKIAERKINE